MKKFIYQILEESPSRHKLSKYIQLFIIFLILINVLAVMIETIEYFGEKYHLIFYYFELFSVAIFTIEYVLRIWSCLANEADKKPIIGRIRYASKPLVIIDLLAILPFYLPMVFPIDLRFVRILRVFRLFRMFKMVRYSRDLGIMMKVLREKKEELIITTFVVIIVLIFSSSLMYYAEHDAQPEVFTSIPSTLWWGVETLTTVGYGDLLPITTIGKICGGIIAIFGIGIFALPAGIIASGFVEVLHQESKMHKCPHCGKEINI